MSFFLENITDKFIVELLRLEGSLRFVLTLLICIAVTGRSEAMRLPQIPSGHATPLYAPLPSLPDTCVGEPTLSGDALRFITLFGVIDWEGRATQVQVQEPSDDCLKEVAVETVRHWLFEPVNLETKEYWLTSFEVTLIYPPDGQPKYEMTDYNALKRYPPRYPDGCLNSARPVEVVAVTFDVSEEGVTENIESSFSTFSCLTGAAKVAVKKWRYAPRLIEGRAFQRENVYTEMAFELADNRLNRESVRRKLSNAFISAGLTLDRKLDSRIALEKLALLEKQFGEMFSDGDKATFLRYRGAAKIDAFNYEGALEDLNSAIALESDAVTVEGLKNVIGQLEAALSEVK